MPFHQEMNLEGGERKARSDKKRPPPLAIRSPSTARWEDRIRTGPIKPALIVCILALGMLAGCLGSREAEEVPPDERFGHRYSNEGPDGRATLTISPPDSNDRYFYYPAIFDTVVVRPAPFSPDSPAGSQEVNVEILVKGSFPDACSELHEVTQERAGNILTATLTMRKPEGSICASVSRPYRFYTMLDGQYSVGNYTLKLNSKVVPFQIRAPRDETR